MRRTFQNGGWSDETRAKRAPSGVTQSEALTPLTPNTVKLIHTLGALSPRGGPVQDPVLTHTLETSCRGDRAHSSLSLTHTLTQVLAFLEQRKNERSLTRRALNLKAVNFVLLFSLRQSTGSDAVAWLH